jgi:hypothetical protein
LPGIEGKYCDTCGRDAKIINQTCHACGECFDKWDTTISFLKSESQKYIITLLLST